MDYMFELGGVGFADLKSKFSTSKFAKTRVAPEPKSGNWHPIHASIHLAAQGTQHERGGRRFGGRPFALSSPHSGRIEGSVLPTAEFSLKPSK